MEGGVSDCAHDWLEVAPEVNETSGPDGSWLELRCRVRCGVCQEPFSFRGLNSGNSNPHEPVTSADGYELRAPIADRPGGVVGVLALAGLEGRLTEEGPRGSD